MKTKQTYFISFFCWETLIFYVLDFMRWIKCTTHFNDPTTLYKAQKKKKHKKSLEKIGQIVCSIFFISFLI